MAAKTMTASSTLALRKKLALNQRDFWKRVGVTQWGGRRYETDRRIPMYLALLLQLAYGKYPMRLYKRLRYQRQQRE
jgi:DNA-binding transcriptional regulator YiaG